MNKDAYDKLTQEIWNHNRLYYVEHNPIISDQEFDYLLKKLEDIEKKHPEWISATSPTQRVGEVLTGGFKTYSHDIPMLSLANSYSKEEIADFINRIEKLTNAKNPVFTCELKMDGIAVSVRYEKGIFIRGLTRGDGKRGDDITNNIKTIKSLPLKIYGDNIPDVLEVRGEVYMSHEAFKQANLVKEKNGESLWVNPRNAAAGSLKLLDPKESAKRNLNIVFYGIAGEENSGIQSQHDVHAYLQKLGLPVLQTYALCKDMNEIWQFIEKVKEQRNKLPFDIDGVVIKLDDIKQWLQIGTTDKIPRWAIAYKYAAEQAQTKILDITVQVGRTGTLTPVAELQPVFVGGSTISRATLHNKDEIKRKDIRIGDLATIEKGGDVIPKVVSVDLQSRPLDTHIWNMPTRCPSCGSLVVCSEDEVAVRCPNSENCPDQQLKKLIYFAGKEAMDIENMGEKVVEQLFSKGFIKHPSDIYKLTDWQLAQLSNFKAKSISNLLLSINKSKEISLSRFIMALGIKYVGKGTADAIANKAGNLQNFLKMTKDDLLKIEGVGDKVASSVFEFITNEKDIHEIFKLLDLGVKPISSNIVEHEGHVFNGKTFVLTGTLSKYNRTEASNLIKERGGKLSDSVSKKTDYVIAGDSAGSKLEKAKSLNITILSENQFEELI